MEQAEGPEDNYIDQLPNIKGTRFVEDGRPTRQDTTQLAI